MATTRLMPLHIGKGRTVGTAIAAIIDYVENPGKTDNGNLITSWQCDSRVADREFLLSKQQYIRNTGRVRGEDDVMKDPYLAFADSVNMICCVFLGFGVYVRLNHVNLLEALQAQHLRKERDTDKLSGLLKKAAIEEQIKTQLAQPHSHGALVIFDIDNFKHINDTYGHIFGDWVLHQVAQCIREVMPHSSLCGRFGGDEFLILLPNITKEELSKLLDELILHGTESIVLPLSKDAFGMSIGAVFYPQAEKKFAGLLQMADTAMYGVKKNMKNGWEIV